MKKVSRNNSSLSNSAEKKKPLGGKKNQGSKTEKNLLKKERGKEKLAKRAREKAKLVKREKKDGWQPQTVSGEKKNKPGKSSFALERPRKIKIKIIGLGGGAASIIREMANALKGGATFLLADTDQRSFRRLPRSIKTLPFGEEETYGWGTGMDTELAGQAALKSAEQIKKLVQGNDLVILVACLGGGVGSGASLVFSQILKEQKILSLGIFTLPFAFEGEKKMRLARNSLKKLKENLSALVVLPNEEILERSDKKLSLKKSLSLMNQVLINYLKDLTEIISLPGVINIDFADLKTILKGKGQAVCFGSGVGWGSNRVEEAMKSIFEQPFFIWPAKIKKILFNISADAGLGLKEVEEAAQKIFKLSPRAKIIFGISEDKRLGKKIKISFLGVGDNLTEEKTSLLSREEEKSLVSSAGTSSRQKKLPEKEKGKKQGEKTKGKSKRHRLKKEKREKSSSFLSFPAEEKEVKMRRSALEVKEMAEEEKEEKWFGNGDEWEVPAFLRGKDK